MFSAVNYYFKCILKLRHIGSAFRHAGIIHPCRYFICKVSARGICKPLKNQSHSELTTEKLQMADKMQKKNISLKRVTQQGHRKGQYRQKQEANHKMNFK